MIERARRMYAEATARYNDAQILSQSITTESDSAAFLKVLAFEVLLKCAVLLVNQSPSKHHNYNKLWAALPGATQKQILAVATQRMPGHVDFSNLKKLLGWYQFVFEKARYQYEIYDGYSDEQVSELGELWESLGSPVEEAVVQYHPNELTCLVFSLRQFIEGKLAAHALA